MATLTVVLVKNRAPVMGVGKHRDGAAGHRVVKHARQESRPKLQATQAGFVGGFNKRTKARWSEGQRVGGVFQTQRRDRHCHPSDWLLME
eukprot:jgi/Mesen1/795/ME000110S_11060